MSYSVCTNCEMMVPRYEKYCEACLKKYPHLKQPEMFWQNSPVSWQQHAKEIARQEIDEPRTRGGTKGKV